MIQYWPYYTYVQCLGNVVVPLDSAMANWSLIHWHNDLPIVSLHSPEPLPKTVGEHVFTPNGLFVLEQACFHVVNMFAHLNRPY